jgi:two-component system, cell cycle sensor histidine kinase and response regulator CckA
MGFLSRNRTLSVEWSYAIALSLVAIIAVLRFSDGLPAVTVVEAPFLFFYPMIALGTLFGGAGPGFTAVAFAAIVVTTTFPTFPSTANWVVLAILGPSVVLGFSRLKRLRDRSRALSEESRRLRFVIDRVSDWIFLTDEQGVIQYANQTACTQLGVPPDRLIGTRIEDITAEAHRAAVRDLLARCRVRSAPPAEILFNRVEHGTVPVEIGCTAISAGDSFVIHVAGRDVAERRAVERKLAEARQWEGLRVLAGGVAHDFNNLLTSILGNASLARATLPECHPVAGLLESIETAGERSAELVRMMLASAGYKSRAREALRLDRVLGKLLAERPLAGSVVLKTDPNVEIESDGSTAETLLWSLILNAAESYGESKGEVFVSISARIEPLAPDGPADFEDGQMPQGPSVQIVVRDSGHGMKPEVLDRAFDPFFTTKFTGRGLGLPAVRGIVRAHGGKLRLRTTPSAGTTVEVWLPAAGHHTSASA